MAMRSAQPLSSAPTADIPTAKLKARSQTAAVFLATVRVCQSGSILQGPSTPSVRGSARARRPFVGTENGS